jgi:hypothetical protein
MSETLKITPTESIAVRSSDDQALLVEAVYRAGKRPPKHFHPAQDEHFEILEGELRLQLDGEHRAYTAGDTFVVSRGAVHTMWCPVGEARVLWRTAPGGRTLQWFHAINRLQVQGRVGRHGMPGAFAFGVLLTEYRDTFRLAGPDWLLRPALGMLASIGRRRGYRP